MAVNPSHTNNGVLIHPSEFMFENSHSYLSDDPPGAQIAPPHNTLLEEKYLLLIKKLNEKCQRIQKENERFIFRLHAVKKQTKRHQRDVALLKNRLDLYNDDWRLAQPPIPKLRKSVIKKANAKINSNKVSVNGQKTPKLSLSGRNNQPNLKKKKRREEKLPRRTTVQPIDPNAVNIPY